MLFIPRTKGLNTENFLKLSDGEEATGIFSGEVHTFKRHWTNNRSAECVGPDCSHCAADPEHYPAFRFRMNFLTMKNNQWTAKIFEGGGEIYDLLTSLDKKFDLSKTVVDITRRGVKQNTKYDILPRLDQPVTAEIRSQLAAVALLALSTTPVGKEQGAA